MIIGDFKQSLVCSDRANVYSEVAVQLTGTSETRWLVFIVKDHTNAEGGSDTYVNETLYPDITDIESKLALNLTRPSDANGWNYIAGHRIESTFEGADAVLSAELYSYIMSTARAYITGRIN